MFHIFQKFFHIYFLTHNFKRVIPAPSDISSDPLGAQSVFGSVSTCHKKSLFWFGCSRQQKRHVATPPPAGVRRRMERNRQKMVGRDKGSLTEQQTKGTVIITIQIRRKHNTNRTTHRAVLPDHSAAARSRAVSEFPPPNSPPTRTQHDGTWYGIPCSVWPGGVSPPGCVPSWIAVKINPVLAKPRTVLYP